MLDTILNGYSDILHFVAEIAVHTLELIGILVIILGSVKVMVETLSRLRKKQPVNAMLALGRTLALALELKMGAEIVNTVIIRDLKELGILAIIIALRAFLALLIHWEIKSELKHQELKDAESNDNNEESAEKPKE